MASSRVACAPTFLGVLGFLPMGDLGVEEAESEEVCDCLGFVSESDSLFSLAKKHGRI